MVLSTSQPTCDKKIIEKILLIVNIIFPSHFDQMDAELSSNFDQESRTSIRTIDYSENGTNSNQPHLLQSDKIVKNLATKLPFGPYPLFSNCKL
ncbi:Protein CBG08189 [Caenorhabditis briggsae]|uniref:Protein CBG08172 n=1 Tax=Caenorhabditis briggsae TaxID=6238 RepID=G2J6M1_CAEBR|nr:Protein CBG08172 [Caenorhabditis briggsae]XP_002643311.1 Protein CBG08189 [Caenorhabditis briggsae]CAP28057.1 Protein CBG08172 [Caenorhabditis briggsae]CAP28072.1 Protein CBG08189 [Caenorhabditis briggsae]